MGLPFFKLLKKYDKFHWTQEAQEAFEELKKYLTTPPTLVAPRTLQKLVAIHIHYKQCSQYSYHRRAGGVEHQPQDPISSLLHQRSAE
jgi:hypothetical protein